MQMYIFRRMYSGQTPGPAPFPAPAALIALFFVILLSGCDVAGLQDDEAVLEYEAGSEAGEAIRFLFAPDTLETGQLVELRAEEALDVSGFLNEHGFSKADITSAELQEATLEVNFPSTEQLDFLNEAILSLTAPGRTAVEVASLSDFPSDDDDASLDVGAGRDIANFLQADQWRPVLLIDASDLDTGSGEYQLNMVLTFRIEVSV